MAACAILVASLSRGRYLCWKPSESEEMSTSTEIVPLQRGKKITITSYYVV
jgi:hypothetical protein